ncbi:unnamed protein product [Rotaria sordida]|uniref:Uncharacterized protein n=1 Tax=Rotaria sordida TaxID=392033 RepID=A0A814IZY1_9BILA|nr:unnamed protein product [Rotaria sordida]
MTSFISAQVLSKTVIQSQVQASIEQFQSAASIQFVTQLQLETKGLSGNSNKCPGNSNKALYASRGMMSGCYPIEALLQPTLQYFYDQQCIDSNGQFLKLDISSLEKRQFNIKCQPSLCSYSYLGHHSTIEIITSLINIYGGLVIITQRIAVILSKVWLCRTHRVNSDTN